tara:strand:- start:1260 stop:1547 length:288 start_codon:yes stop_codon:yes gene_type:complete
MLVKKKQLVNLTLLSMRYDNCFNDGYQNYRFWKNIIQSTTGIYQENVSRLIFRQLIRDGNFDKKKEHKKVAYLFNPDNRKYIDKYENYDGVVTFD